MSFSWMRIQMMVGQDWIVVRENKMNKLILLLSVTFTSLVNYDVRWYV